MKSRKERIKLGKGENFFMKTSKVYDKDVCMLPKHFDDVVK